MVFSLSRTFFNSTQKVASHIRSCEGFTDQVLWQGRSLISTAVFQDKSQAKVIRVVENFLRDGIQSLSSVSSKGEKTALVLSTDVKLAMYAQIVAAGFSGIEIGSMVKLSSMANTPEFYRSLKPTQGVVFDILVPNKGKATTFL